MPKTFVDRVLDVETSRKRSFHGVGDVSSLRITQFGYFDPANKKLIIGGGPGKGWTDLIAPLVDKHKPMSEMNLPSAFWKELAMYNPSVAEEGSFLNAQVRDHVREYLALKQTGQHGEMKSAVEYINMVRNDIQNQIDLGNSVRLSAYNKDFDINAMMNEMFRASPKEGRDFMNWMKGHERAGRLQVVGIEEPIQDAMFDIMMKEKDVMPRYASSKYFQKAQQAGLKTVGLEATNPHYALRTMIDDIKAIQSGTPIKQVLQGMPKDIQAEFAKIKDAKDYRKFYEWVENRPGGEKTVGAFYRAKAAKKYGVKVAKHVVSPSTKMVSGYRHDLVAELLGGQAGTHRGPEDVVAEWETKVSLGGSKSKAARSIARTVMTDEGYIAKEAGVKYGKYLEESGKNALKTGSVRELLTVAPRTRIVPPAALSRLARSPNTLPLLAAAGGLLIANQIAKSVYIPPMIEGMREEMEGRIEGLRKSMGQWDNQSGIEASDMPFANVSDFGSGRRGAWEAGSYKGVDFSPTHAYYSQQWALNPDWQYEVAKEDARLKVSAWGPTREELNNRRLEMSDYIYEVEDADTLIMRKAWISQNIPILGPAMGALQSAIQNSAKLLTGQDFGFKVRVEGVDAPEIAHPNEGPNYIPGSQPGSSEANQMMERIMGGGSVQRLLFGSRATHINISGLDVYGRTLGTPYAGASNLAGELVQSGGAVATSLRDNTFLAQENIARSSGRGLWKHPMYQAVPAARKRGIYPSIGPVMRYSRLTESLDAAAMQSLMTYARNPQMHGVRDQHAQGLYTRGY